MKKIIALLIIASVTLLSFASCQSAEDHYDDKAICVEVTHTSGSGGYENSEKYDLYFNEIKKGEKYELPNGESNPYEVDFTITSISKENITITFSQTMCRVTEDTPTEWIYNTEFTVSVDNSELFSTPTDGGGDSFRFTIVDRTDLQ